MNMKTEVTCAKCGKAEMVPADQAVGAVSGEHIKAEALAGKKPKVLLCDKCTEAFEAFREAMKN